MAKSSPPPSTAAKGTFVFASRLRRPAGSLTSIQSESSPWDPLFLDAAHPDLPLSCVYYCVFLEPTPSVFLSHTPHCLGHNRLPVALVWVRGQSGSGNWVP
eukprot:EG_transcript_42473